MCELDFLTSIGNKINITMAAEAQAKTGHDIYAFDQWTVHQYGDKLDPMDDVMKSLIAKYGKLGHAYEYLAWSTAIGWPCRSAWGSAPLTALRAHQHAEEVRQYRRAGVVSGA